MSPEAPAQVAAALHPQLDADVTTQSARSNTNGGLIKRWCGTRREKVRRLCPLPSQLRPPSPR